MVEEAKKSDDAQVVSPSDPETAKAKVPGLQIQVPGQEEEKKTSENKERPSSKQDGSGRTSQ